jgi:hypothetical protein
MDKTFKITVGVITSKPEKLPDWGLGPGILTSQEAIIKEKDLNNEFLYHNLYEIGKEIRDNTIEIKITGIDE